MRLLLINSVCGIGSTGRICLEIARRHEAQGDEVSIACGRMPQYANDSGRFAVKIGSGASVVLHGLITRLMDFHGTGLCSYLETKRFLHWAEQWEPDVIWIHNLHGYYLNYPLLFAWLKRHSKIEVRWTLHDCWTFTGHCAYFTAAKCEKWKTCCHHCPERHQYPASWGLDMSHRNWFRKKECFCGLKNLTLITPSKWLADLTRKSFLKEYPVKIVNNTIDTSVFKPTDSDFRKMLGLEGKTIVLGVASVWDRRKGLDDFIELRGLLDEAYAVVLVGLSAGQIKSLPEGIVGISKTNDARELAGLYSSADWFFNPTHEENYPTVNLEAKACGCRIVTYDTGGSAETVEGYDKAWVLSGNMKSPNGFVSILKTTAITRGGGGNIEACRFIPLLTAWRGRWRAAA